MKQRRCNVAILVHSCDRYAFLYEGFQVFFEKNWSDEIICNYYFATEEAVIDAGRFQNIQSGKGEWADRLARLLKEKIKEKYVLYFQEDMWLTRPINPQFFNRLFTLADELDWQQVKLHSSDAYTTHATPRFIEGFNVATLDNIQSKFLMSHQVTLWNKTFLLKQLRSREHPWRNERRGTRRLKKQDPMIVHIDYFAENGQPENNQNQGPVLRSAYHTVSVNGRLGDPVQAYIDALLTDGQYSEHRQYGLQLEHHYQHQLTHDGLPPPRKIDLFKKTKTWVRQHLAQPQATR